VAALIQFITRHRSVGAAPAHGSSFAGRRADLRITSVAVLTEPR